MESTVGVAVADNTAAVVVVGGVGKVADAGAMERSIGKPCELGTPVAGWTGRKVGRGASGVAVFFGAAAIERYAIIP